MASVDCLNGFVKRPDFTRFTCNFLYSVALSTYLAGRLKVGGEGNHSDDALNYSGASSQVNSALTFMSQIPDKTFSSPVQPSPPHTWPHQHSNTLLLLAFSVGRPRKTWTVQKDMEVGPGIEEEWAMDRAIVWRSSQVQPHTPEILSHYKLLPQTL